MLNLYPMPSTPTPSTPPVPAGNNPIAQLEVVLTSRRNAAAGLIGAIGGLVPYGAYRLGHYELTSWDPRVCPKALVVYAALLFSVLTVSNWALEVFQTPSRTASWIKAIGFTALVETLMMTSDYPPLALGCLGLLVTINAVANGCRLAQRAAARPEVNVPAAAPVADTARYRVGKVVRMVRA